MLVILIFDGRPISHTPGPVSASLAAIAGQTSLSGRCRPASRRFTPQLRIEPCGLSRQVVAFGEVWCRSGGTGGSAVRLDILYVMAVPQEYGPHLQARIKCRIKLGEWTHTA